MFVSQETEYSKKIKADSKALEEANRFTDQDGREMEKKIRTMNEKRQKMSRTVNKKAQNTVDQDEKQVRRHTIKYILVCNCILILVFRTSKKKGDCGNWQAKDSGDDRKPGQAEERNVEPGLEAS